MKNALLFIGAAFCLAALPIRSAGESESIHLEPERYNTAAYELGTIFRPLVNGKVKQVRVFALAEESGEHVVRIWRNADNRVIAGPISWNYGGVDGWTNLDIPDLPVEAEEEY